MTFPEITQTLKRETEAWNAHDADGVAACYAEDAVLYDVGLPEPLRGRVASAGRRPTGRRRPYSRRRNGSCLAVSAATASGPGRA